MTHVQTISASTLLKELSLKTSSKRTNWIWKYTEHVERLASTLWVAITHVGVELVVVVALL